MKVTAEFHGLLSDWVGTGTADFELEEGAPLADLLAEIGRRYRRNMPDQIWDDDRNSFKKRILATIDGGAVRDPHTPLSNGQEIRFLLMMAGG